MFQGKAKRKKMSREKKMCFVVRLIKDLLNILLMLRVNIKSVHYLSQKIMKSMIEYNKYFFFKKKVIINEGYDEIDRKND